MQAKKKSRKTEKYSEISPIFIDKNASEVKQRNINPIFSKIILFQMQGNHKNMIYFLLHS